MEKYTLDKEEERILNDYESGIFVAVRNKKEATLHAVNVAKNTIARRKAKSI